MTRRLAADVRAVLPAWIAARVLVLAGWAAALAWTELRRGGSRSEAMSQGLFAWDGVFYRGIGQTGYAGQPAEALRFFPLYPLTGRMLSTIVPLSVALVLVANLAALVGGALVRRLGVESGLTPATATRAAWLLTLAPPAFVFVWGYVEGLFVLLVAITLLALRRRCWWLAAAAGFSAGLARPTGALLAVAAFIEAARGLRGLPRSSRAAGRELGGRVGAIVAPVLGTVSYLWWVGSSYGDWALPLRIQDNLRGGTVNPIVRVGEAGIDLARFDVHGLHFPFAVAMIVLAAVVARRLPAPLSLYSAVSVAVILAAANLNSSERYALGAVPLAFGLALLTEDRGWRWPTILVSGMGLVALTTLAWLQIYVP